MGYLFHDGGHRELRPILACLFENVSIASFGSWWHVCLKTLKPSRIAVRDMFLCGTGSERLPIRHLSPRWFHWTKTNEAKARSGRLSSQHSATATLTGSGERAIS